MKHLGFKHIGLSEYRIADNPKEEIFANKWKEMQENSNTLFYLIDRNESLLTQRDCTVAATIIQWLGSPVGQNFLKDVADAIENK